MANLGKKWGAVIACWAVALVLVIAGICMGLVIPSSAASDYEGDIAVMFDADGDGKYSEEEITIYHKAYEAFDALNAFETTSENQATIQLRSNVTSEGIGGSMYKDYTLDLNGYVLLVEGIMQIINCDNKVKIIDSRSDTEHYFAYVGNGQYEYRDTEKLGFNSVVNGGVIMNSYDWPSMFVTSADKGNSQLIINGGTYLGNMLFGMQGGEQGTAEIELNPGVNIHCGVNAKGSFGFDDDIEISFMSQGNAKLKINGGNIYGKVVEGKFDDKGALVGAEVVDLSAEKLPDWVEINKDIKMKPQTDANGDTYYAAVDANTEEPTTKPTDPIAEANADDNNNMIALIVLGAAAAVMVVGVAVIIMVNAKRRKKAA